MFAGTEQLFRKVGMAFFLSSMLIVSGCVTGPSVSDEDLNTDQQDLRNSTSEFDSQTVFEGVAAGAATGALIGFITSGGDIQAAVIGAAAGAAAGGLIGYAIADKNAEYAQQENELDVLIADAEFRTNKLATLTATAEGVLANDKLKLAELQRQIDAQSVSREDALMTLAIIQDDLRVINDAVLAAASHSDLLNNNIAEREKNMPDEDIDALRTEVAAYDTAAESFTNSVDDAEFSAQLTEMETLVESYAPEPSA